MKKNKKAAIIRLIKYTLFAASAGVIQIVSFTLLNEFSGMPYWPCYLISLALSVIWNFTFNRKFTFKSANNVPIAMLKVIGYYVVFTPLSTLWGHFLVEKALWNEYLVEALTMIINFVTEFLFQRFFVFGKTLDTNDRAKREAEKEAAARVETGEAEKTEAMAEEAEDAQEEE